MLFCRQPLSRAGSLAHARQAASATPTTCSSRKAGSGWVDTWRTSEKLDTYGPTSVRSVFSLGRIEEKNRAVLTDDGSEDVQEAEQARVVGETLAAGLLPRSRPSSPRTSRLRGTRTPTVGRGQTVGCLFRMPSRNEKLVNDVSVTLISRDQGRSGVLRCFTT